MEEAPAVQYFSDLPLPTRKRCWDEVLLRYEGLRSRSGFTNVNVLIDLVRSLATSPQALRFRPGTSMLALVLSTAAEYSLRAGDCIIGISVSDDGGSLAISYCRLYGEPEQIGRARTTAQALDLLEPQLRRLWSDMHQVIRNGPN